MTKIEQLKPCPFCGGDAVKNQIARHNFMVGCSKCHASVSAKWCTQELAIEAWNNRPSNTQMHMDAALCEECIKIGRNGEHSWHCRKCGKELHQ